MARFQVRRFPATGTGDFFFGGDLEKRDSELLADRGTGGGEVGLEDGGAEIDEVEDCAGDGGGEVWVVGDEGVVEPVGLDEAVSGFGDLHGEEDAGAEADGFHFGDVLGQEV